MEVEGQYYFDIILENGDSILGDTEALPDIEKTQKSIIDADTNILNSFILTQYGINALPTFKVDFVTQQESDIRQLNEGNIVTLNLGWEKKAYQSTKCCITQADIYQYGSGKRQVKFEGILNKPEYVNLTKYGMTERPESAIQVAIRVLEPYFDVESNIQVSQDKQIWIQPTITDRQFVTHLLQHCRLQDSFPAINISPFRDICRLVDVRNLLQTFTPYDIGLDTVWTPLPGASYRIMSAGFNQIAGYKSKQRVINQDSGMESAKDDIIVDAQPLFSESNALNRHPHITDPRLNKIYVQNANHDSHYHVTRLRNQTLASVVSEFKTQIILQGYRELKPYDLVRLLEGSIYQDKLIAEELSGIFIIEEVNYMIQKDYLFIALKLTRESPGNMQGSFS